VRAQESEYEYTIKLANAILDKPGLDPDGNECVLARQFLRAVERLGGPFLLRSESERSQPNTWHEDRVLTQVARDFRCVMINANPPKQINIRITDDVRAYVGPAANIEIDRITKALNANGVDGSQVKRVLRYREDLRADSGDLLVVEVVPPVDHSARCLADGSPVTDDHRELRPDGQQKGYIVLTAEERAKGFVRPVRRSYVHVGKPPAGQGFEYPITKVFPGGCGSRTTMSEAIAELSRVVLAFTRAVHSAAPVEPTFHSTSASGKGPQNRWDHDHQASFQRRAVGGWVRVAALVPGSLS
jgi:hypothetical protein